jgi:hypothetical protein
LFEAVRLPKYAPPQEDDVTDFEYPLFVSMTVAPETTALELLVTVTSKELLVFGPNTSDSVVYAPGESAYGGAPHASSISYPEIVGV